MVKNKPCHILVIRFSALGDVAMTVPVLTAFQNRFPDTRITFLTRPFYKPIFNGLENVHVEGADLKGKHKGIAGMGRLYSHLAKMEIDAVADLHNVLRTKILKKYFLLSKIPFVQIDKGRKEKRALTRPLNKKFGPLKSTFERYADVFRQLGFDIDLEESRPQTRLPLSFENKPDLKRSTAKWIGIAPFAAFRSKMYPLQEMEEVIAGLNNTNKYKLLLFGAGDEEVTVLKGFAEKYANAVNMAGVYTFQEELAVISNLDLMVSMDSGNGHLAAMFDVPAVTIWGVTHPYAGFAPFGHDQSYSMLPDRNLFPLLPTSVYGNKFPKGYDKAIGTITPAQILDKIESVLTI
ncbi:MAG: glycosyltransferase family 9 protein [Flavobacteriaceae bacterium]